MGLAIHHIGKFQAELGEVGRRRQGETTRTYFGYQQPLQEVLDAAFPFFVEFFHLFGRDVRDRGHFFHQAIIDILITQNLGYSFGDPVAATPNLTGNGDNSHGSSPIWMVVLSSN